MVAVHFDKVFSALPLIQSNMFYQQKRNALQKFWQI